MRELVVSPVNIIRETTTRNGCGAGGERRRDGVQDGLQVWWVCERCYCQSASLPACQHYDGALATDDHLPAGERRGNPPPPTVPGSQGPRVPRPKPPSTTRFAQSLWGGHAQAHPPAMFDGAQPGGMMGIWLPSSLAAVTRLDLIRFAVWTS